MSVDRAKDALFFLDSGVDRDTWHAIGRSAISAGLSIDDIDAWSATASNYKGTQDVKAAFRTIKPEGGTGPATLFRFAMDAGWPDPYATQASHAAGRSPPVPRNLTKIVNAELAFARFVPATNQHGYVVAKKASSTGLDGLRVVPPGDPLHITKQSMVGYLAVPAYAQDGAIQSIQFIPPDGGKKLNLPGASMSGASFTVGPPDGPAYLCEGIGQAWAVWSATGSRAVVCFGWGNIGKIAAALRTSEPGARLVLCPDRGKEPEAHKIAAELGCAVSCLPECEPDNFDVNDLFQRDGFDVLAALLESAKEPPVKYPLKVAFADQLPDVYGPPDELVEGFLTAGDGSMLYGDSNSGKTFLVIDMAVSVARGVPWMGRRVEQGAVLYLAAESPGSVRRRIQAYQKHHGCKVPNFAIVQSTVDLFADDADTNKIIALVHQIERQSGIKVRLIVGDTLARMSAGANENAGQDMGRVVSRFDRIRTECAAHFLLVHHSGKAAASGARGWSGIRAAVDTEIEISDSLTGRCVEITKQRDLSTKGERIGFRLEPVTLGETKWGMPATSCVVISTDAPRKPNGKRMGESEGAVLEFLQAHKVGIKKAEVAKHFDGRYDRSNVYRAIRNLESAQAIHAASGMVCIAESAK